jgi:hypothetical protein
MVKKQVKTDYTFETMFSAVSSLSIITRISPEIASNKLNDILLKQKTLLNILPVGTVLISFCKIELSQLASHFCLALAKFFKIRRRHYIS